MNNFSRRQLLWQSLLGVAGAVAAKSANAATCIVTPSQQEGPYYPETDLERDSDLTRLESDGDLAEGQGIYIAGKVSDADCKPIADALVEIWQACFSGKYNHTGDTNPLELDRNFQYWGRARTNEKGEYLFKTIIPGHYPIGGGVYRPPHVHFKVYARKFYTLTTQMYFNPDSYDDPEIAKIVDKWNKYESVDRRLMVLFKPVEVPTLDPKAKIGTFDISLRKQP